MSFLNPASGEVLVADYTGDGLPPLVAVGDEVFQVRQDGDFIDVTCAANATVATLFGGPAPTDLTAYPTSTGGVFWVVTGGSSDESRYVVVNFTVAGERVWKTRYKSDGGYSHLYDVRLLDGIVLGLVYERSDDSTAYVMETRFAVDGNTRTWKRHSRDTSIPTNLFGLDDRVLVMYAGYNEADKVVVATYTDGPYSAPPEQHLVAGGVITETQSGRVLVQYAGVERDVWGTEVATSPQSDLFLTGTYAVNRLGWMLQYEGGARLAGGGVYFLTAPLQHLR